MHIIIKTLLLIATGLALYMANHTTTPLLPLTVAILNCLSAGLYDGWRAIRE